MGKILRDEKSELEQLRAENAALKAEKERSIKLKVSTKGGLSLYGLGRFPITLYREQWAKILEMADEIRAFVVAHDKELKSKGE